MAREGRTFWRRGNATEVQTSRRGRFGARKSPLERHLEAKAMSSATQPTPTSKAMIWTGRVISGITVLFLIFDGVTKVMKESHVMAASAKMGYPASAIVGTGVTLLVCVALYVIPRTSILGAVLLTGYLGGAVATHVFIRDPLFDTVFPIIFGAFVWGGPFLRDGQLRMLIPVRR